MTRSTNAQRVTRGIAAAFVVLAMVVLAGCARIPTSGQVLAGESEQQESDQSYSFFPDAPRDGMSREEIVEGFLDAGTGTQNDYAVAREYLADSFRQEWDPNARILITASVPSVVDAGADRIEASYKSTATVDADGLYSELGGGTTERLSFTLAQDADGEWRITEAPPGIVLLAQNFRSLFKSYTLYFYDDTLSRLVPDVRWFDAQQTAMTRIARALVNGPAPWLADGKVVSAIPSDVTLLGAVTVEGETADVDFSSNLSSASPERYSRMLLQLTESFGDFEAISSVTMSITGVPIDQELPGDDDVIVNRQVTSTPLVYKAGELGFLSGPNVTASEETAALQGAIAPLSPQKGAYAADRDVASFVTPNGVFTTPIADPDPLLVDARPGPLAMSLDSWGYTWTGSTDGSGLRATDVEDRQHSWLEPAENVGATGYRAIAVSRDGARLAVLENTSVGVRVAVMAIEREPGTNRPIALGTPLLLAPGGTSPIDLAWVDETSLAVLAIGSEGTAEVRTQTVGGTVTVNGAVLDGQQITGSNTPAGLRVLDKEHHIYVPKGNRWQQSDATVDFILTQV
ncbi:LpqB family beta-propeller domain-containing protein [Pseudoclavibacter helvolus]|uniref:LpqB family beta-propeller domain-containing protein n=1 Tax=Pseudoclavibacter helvolus TaxID=255205 RepID=UPI003C78B8FB